MSRRDHGPAVVAELGRPETPEETAARKAQNSRNHRDRQTTRNLVLALLASLGVVILIVLMVPRGDVQVRPDIDYRAVAAEAQPALDETLLVPEPGDGWDSNSAELRSSTADGVTSWYVGFLTPSDAFLGFTQGIDANPSWVASELGGVRPTGSAEIDGRTWEVYDYRESRRDGNRRYGMSLQEDGHHLVIYGTASDAEAYALAAAAGRQIEEDE